MHAVKLFQGGNVCLRGTREVIKPNPQDKMVANWLENGVPCEVRRFAAVAVR